MAKTPQKPTLQFPPADREILKPYLPLATPTNPTKPFVTLTFATSLDSSLSLAPGTQTTLSGPETKAMTHYLRSEHDAILIGVGTAIADNPALNCRLQGVGLHGQPRPVIIDPNRRWKPSVGHRDDDDEEVAPVVVECIRLAAEKLGKAPWIVTAFSEGQSTCTQLDEDGLIEVGGKYISVPSTEKDGRKQLRWPDILDALASEGIKSVMIEGGGSVINTLLQEQYLHLIDSVIITVAPVWLGTGGVVVSPPPRTDGAGARIPAARLHQTKWQQFGDDVVMCGRIKH